VLGAVVLWVPSVVTVTVDAEGDFGTMSEGPEADAMGIPMRDIANAVDGLQFIVAT
jgi:hypothetical protein